MKSLECDGVFVETNRHILARLLHRYATENTPLLPPLISQSTSLLAPKLLA
jgi:hypothetical protein